MLFGRKKTKHEEEWDECTWQLNNCKNVKLIYSFLGDSNEKPIDKYSWEVSFKQAIETQYGTCDGHDCWFDSMRCNTSGEYGSSQLSKKNVGLKQNMLNCNDAFEWHADR